MNGGWRGEGKTKMQEYNTHCDVRMWSCELDFARFD